MQMRLTFFTKYLFPLDHQIRQISLLADECDAYGNEIGRDPALIEADRSARVRFYRKLEVTEIYATIGGFVLFWSGAVLTYLLQYLLSNYLGINGWAEAAIFLFTHYVYFKAFWAWKTRTGHLERRSRRILQTHMQEKYDAWERAHGASGRAAVTQQREVKRLLVSRSGMPVCPPTAYSHSQECRQ